MEQRGTCAEIGAAGREDAAAAVEEVEEASMASWLWVGRLCMSPC